MRTGSHKDLGMSVYFIPTHLNKGKLTKGIQQVCWLIYFVHPRFFAENSFSLKSVWFLRANLTLDKYIYIGHPCSVDPLTGEGDKKSSFVFNIVFVINGKCDREVVDSYHQVFQH